MMPKKAKLELSPQVPWAAKATPMTHGVGGPTQDFYLSARREIRSWLIMGIKIWGRQ